MVLNFFHRSASRHIPKPGFTAAEGGIEASNHRRGVSQISCLRGFNCYGTQLFPESSFTHREGPEPGLDLEALIDTYGLHPRS